MRRTKPSETHRHYYALVVPGIEDLASDEIRTTRAKRLDVLSRFDKRDSIVVFEALDARAALRSALIEDLFRVLLDVPTPTARIAPKLIARSLDRPTLEQAMLEHHALADRKRGRSFKVVARVSGRHAFRREDIESAFRQRLSVLLPHWVSVRTAAAIELWVHVVGARTIVGLRLSGDELAHRRYKTAHIAGSLKPTVARALVKLSCPSPDDVFLDPMMGAGTILRERADALGAHLIVGGDRDRDAVAAACENVGRSGRLLLSDATRLPVKRGCANVVVTNPPYGRQHSHSGDLPVLYGCLFREIARVLVTGGRAVVLTGEPAILTRSIPKPLTVTHTRRLLVRGLPVIAFVMVRK